MGFIEWLFGFLTLTIIIVVVALYEANKDVNNENNEENNDEKTDHNIDKIYVQKRFLTHNELVFLNKLKELENETNLKVVPQVNLATIIQKVSNIPYQTELFRNIDYGIFDNNYEKILLLIELNDNTHNNGDRKYRDHKVREICNIANVKLITFYTNYPNETEYVTHRIKKEILNFKASSPTKNIKST